MSDLLLIWANRFHCFSPFYAQERIFKTEWPWAILSRRSWQKSDETICSFSRANHSFAHKKTSNFLKKPMSKFPTLAQTYMQYIKLSWFTELAVKSVRRVRGTFAANIQHTTLCYNQWCGSGSVFVDPDPYHWLYWEIFIKVEHWNLLQIYTSCETIIIIL